ncbi:MAG: hypothetical protein RIR39_1848 [Pseudomonadota bacterium]|jgi:hypothetical protein
MQSYSKNIKRLLREYIVKAYDRELHRELVKLDISFAQWRDGKIDSDELNYRIHQYYSGASRDLYKKYNNGYDDMNVAYAIVTGILNRDEIPAELLEALAGLLEAFQSIKDEGELNASGE